MVPPYKPLLIWVKHFPTYLIYEIKRAHNWLLVWLFTYLCYFFSQILNILYLNGADFGECALQYNNTGITLNMSLNPKMFINELRTTTSSTDSSKPSSWRSWGSVMKRKDSSMLYKLYNYYGTTKHDWVLISNLLENNKILPLPRSVICTCVRITMPCEPRLRIKRSESLLQLKQLLLSGCTWDRC